MRKMILTISTFLLCLAGQAQNMASGFIFEDLNENGRKEDMESGIPKVAVTNGKDVVLSDSRGYYELPVANHNIISVIKPSGFSLKVNEKNLPQFFYIHKPEGSPQMKYSGTEPTGDLPTSIDFGLLKYEGSEEFSALIFGDPQPYTHEEVGHFARGIVSEVEGIENVIFGLSLGDLVGNDLHLFNPYIDAVKKVGIPWYNVLGNHDLNFDVETDEMSDETFEAHFGPANYAFNYGKVHFIVLDDVLYPDPRDGRGYWAGFREDQLAFIKNDLKYVPKDHLIVLAFHIPLSNSFRKEDRIKLFDFLKDYPNTLSLSAHTHSQRQDFFSKEDGWQREKPHHHYNVGTTSGDWYSGKLDPNGIPIATMRDGTPKGYSFINFKGNEYTIDYKVAGRSADYRMQIFVPNVVAKGKKTKAGIYVNFFMGTEDDTVLYRVDDQEWKAMRYIEDYDPSFLTSVYEWDLAEELMPGRRPSNPSKSTHLWRGSIPANLEVGEHEIEVKVMDMFGNTFIESRTYRLEDPIRIPNQE